MVCDFTTEVLSASIISLNKYYCIWSVLKVNREECEKRNERKRTTNEIGNTRLTGNKTGEDRDDSEMNKRKTLLSVELRNENITLIETRGRTL